MEETRYLIVGAGITGLAFADWIDSDDYVICEALPNIGGYCNTIHKDGFVWDYSGHFFHFRDKEIERYLVDRMEGQPVRTVAKDSRILYGDRYVDFPFQKNIHQLPHAEFLECLVSLFFRAEGEPQSFEQMLRLKFGDGIAEKFLIPYNKKLYATDLDKLDVDAMGRFFPHASIEEIIRNFRSQQDQSYNATFTYPEGGAIQYVRALAKGVRPDAISLQEPVQRIDLNARVAHTANRSIHYQYLVSSAPIDRLLGLVGMAFDQKVFSYNKVEVFNLGFDTKGLPDVHWVYIPDPSVCFYRVGFYDNIWNGDRMSLYVEIGHPQDATIDTDEGPQLERVLSDLRRVGLVQGQQLVAHHHVVLDPAYVHITKRSLSEVERLKRILQAAGVYSVGRYGAWTYCSIEDNIIEARALADTLNALEPA